MKTCLTVIVLLVAAVSYGSEHETEADDMIEGSYHCKCPSDIPGCLVIHYCSEDEYRKEQQGEREAWLSWLYPMDDTQVPVPDPPLTLPATEPPTIRFREDRIPCTFSISPDEPGVAIADCSCEDSWKSLALGSGYVDAWVLFYERMCGDIKVRQEHPTHRDEEQE